ncbi:hypothetical protein RRG08_013802 [Elysia crispata]|uniref:Uncharacterized protein n=1 Tax=Elysia crispata TaxID=231223 RepID=A0AAE1ED42_9GAST|nr:hypothetical protein RRG08_013802 [Elysia crispata]
MRATHLPLCLVSKSLQGGQVGEQLTQSLASCLSHSREDRRLNTHTVFGSMTHGRAHVTDGTFHRLLVLNVL